MNMILSLTKKWFLLSALLAAFYSCKSAKVANQATQIVTTQRDSTATRTEVRDSLLVVRKAEMAQLSHDIANLNLQGVSKTEGSATITLRRTGDRIDASCECAELKQAVQLYEKIIENWMLRETNTQTETTVVEEQMPGWAKPFLYIGMALVAYGVLSLVLKFKSKIF